MIGTERPFRDRDRSQRQFGRDVEATRGDEQTGQHRIGLAHIPRLGPEDPGFNLQSTVQQSFGLIILGTVLTHRRQRMKSAHREAMLGAER
jgi:hypothetical protein